MIGICKRVDQVAVKKAQEPGARIEPVEKGGAE